MSNKELIDMVEKTPLTSAQLLKALLERFDDSAKRIFSLREAAQYLGVSVPYVQRLYKERHIAVCKPVITERTDKVGRGKSTRVYFLREDLDSFMVLNRIPSRYEVDRQASNDVLSNLK